MFSAKDNRAFAKVAAATKTVVVFWTKVTVQRFEKRVGQIERVGKFEFMNAISSKKHDFQYNSYFCPSKN